MQIRQLLVLLLTPLVFLTSCKTNKVPKEEIIGPNMPSLNEKLLTPEVLWSFGRLGEISVSPDSKTIAYTVTWYSIEKNKGNSELFVMNADGSDK